METETGLTSMLALAEEFEGRGPLQGTKYFSYEGENLVDRRERLGK